jgi:hypothetical protein
MTHPVVETLFGCVKLFAGSCKRDEDEACSRHDAQPAVEQAGVRRRSSQLEKLHEGASSLTRAPVNHSLAAARLRRCCTLLLSFQCGFDGWLGCCHFDRRLPEHDPQDHTKESPSTANQIVRIIASPTRTPTFLAKRVKFVTQLSQPKVLTTKHEVPGNAREKDKEKGATRALDAASVRLNRFFITGL